MHRPAVTIGEGSGRATGYHDRDDGSVERRAPGVPKERREPRSGAPSWPTRAQGWRRPSSSPLFTRRAFYASVTALVRVESFLLTGAATTEGGGDEPGEREVERRAGRNACAPPS